MARAARLMLALLPSSMLLVLAALMPVLRLQLILVGLSALMFVGAIVLLVTQRRASWNSMGRALGLEPLTSGPYAEMVGEVRGLHVRIRREQVGERRRKVERTVIRLPTGDELRLPGVVTDAMALRDLLLPFASPEPDAARGDVKPHEEAQDGAAVEQG